MWSILCRIYRDIYQIDEIPQNNTLAFSAFNYIYTQNNTMAVLRYWYVVLKITQWHLKDQTVYLQIQTLLLPNGLTFRDYVS